MKKTIIALAMVAVVCVCPLTKANATAPRIKSIGAVVYQSTVQGTIQTVPPMDAENVYVFLDSIVNKAVRAGYNCSYTSVGDTGACPWSGECIELDMEKDLRDGTIVYAAFLTGGGSLYVIVIEIDAGQKELTLSQIKTFESGILSLF
jgi:hypothetical protein